MSTALSGDWRLVRRIPVASLASDPDPTLGLLPAPSQWAGAGAPQALGLIRLLMIYADGSDVQVPGGDVTIRAVEPAINDIAQGASGITVEGRIAIAAYSDELGPIPAGSVEIIDATQAGYITFAVTDYTAPVGATQLLMLARKV